PDGTSMTLRHHPLATQLCSDSRRRSRRSPSWPTAASPMFSNGSRGLFSVFRRFGMPVFSARSQALDGVSWVQGGKVENAVGQGLAACYRIGAVVCSLPLASLLAGARCGLLSQ